MAKQISQLTQLIWDYYRENWADLERLRCLGRCDVFRRWGVLHIRCYHPRDVEAVVRSRSLIAVPLAKLRIVQKVKILQARAEVMSFKIGADMQLA
ncbi:hypothetical protein VB712_15450 [Spirulina sp. CCNP1310]|uniref:hypothetical protein n=1 Tax=Spirulina sp. CCNP1310 TaxID=3110249 RepID=UPI002B20E137|nr:hypothetical protein [Spirulina sp. CCNP1310]MEA5420628.1 hypothetical protein [Spirulina sp. CCNP1310]